MKHSTPLHFKTIITTAILFAILLFTNKNANAQTHNIVLGRPTDTSITASVMFDYATQYYLEYGTASGSYPHQTSTFTSAVNTPNNVSITNLSGNTKYYYRLQYKSGGSFTPSSEYSFHTQRATGSTFTFTVEADEHLYDKKGVKNMYNVTLQNEANDKPDFMMTLGDIFGDDHQATTISSGALDTLHRNYRPILGQITHSIPFYVCLGNHEGEKDYWLKRTPPNNMAIYGTRWRKFYYPNPEPNSFYTGDTINEPYGIGHAQNYYAWTWGDASFVVLDVYRYDCDTSAKPHNWDWTLGKIEYDWLTQTLQNSTSKYKFVFAHHIRAEDRGGITNAHLYEWGGYDGATGTTYSFPTQRPGWAKPIHQLFVDNGVTMFIQGHDHLFAHEIMDGVTYIETPMAADSTYQIGMLANASAYTADTVDGTGHLRFTVSSSCVKMDYVKAYLPKDTLGIHKNGEIGFSVTIGTCTTPNGINEVVTTENVQLYPNPTNTSCSINFSLNEKIKAVQIMDVVGRTVYENNNCFSGMKINTENIPNGIYLVNVIGASNKVVKKLIVNH